MTKRIRVDAPVVELHGASERLTLRMGGKEYTLVGDGTDKDVRGLAVALHTARSVTLEIEESSFPVPKVFLS